MKRLLPILGAFVVAFVAVAAFVYLTRDDEGSGEAAGPEVPTNPEGTVPPADACEGPAPTPAPEPEPGSDAADQVVVLRDDEIAPDELTAFTGVAVTFRNESATEQCVRFTNFAPEGTPITSGPIPPGGSWGYTSSFTGSVVFETADGLQGRLQLEG